MISKACTLLRIQAQGALPSSAVARCTGTATIGISERGSAHSAAGAAPTSGIRGRVQGGSFWHKFRLPLTRNQWTSPARAHILPPTLAAHSGPFSGKSLLATLLPDLGRGSLVAASCMWCPQVQWPPAQVQSTKRHIQRTSCHHRSCGGLHEPFCSDACTQLAAMHDP